MTRLQRFFASSIICILLNGTVLSVKGLSTTKKTTNNDEIKFVSFKAELQYASVAIHNNGMVQYVIKVIDAENTECFFHVLNLEEEILVNDVTRKGNVVIGFLLLGRGPAWVFFECFSEDDPVISHYVFSNNMPSNVSTQMELRDEHGCKIREPVFSSNGSSFIVEIQANCNFALKQENAYLSFQGAVLKNGNISYLSDEDPRHVSTTFKNGVAKARFFFSSHIPSSTRHILWFTLQMKNPGSDIPLISHKYMYLSNKALDGTSPVIPRGTVAITVPPTDIMNIRRGSKAEVTCAAYGNPKPLVKWVKNEQQPIEGEKGFESPAWDTFYDYKSFVIESMDASYVGEYTCQATVLGKTLTKSIKIEVCDPATVVFDITEDENYINAALSAFQNDTNRIFRAHCYRGRRATNDGLLQNYDSPVRITSTEIDLTWKQTYSWRTADKEDVPKEMYCEIKAKCLIYPMTFDLNVSNISN